MAKITRIKAKDPAQKEEKPPKKAEEKIEKAPVAEQKHDEPEKKPKKIKKAKKTEKAEKEEKPLKKVFILARPFVALGRYLRDSWRELRQVRWPNRKSTWQMTLAVLIYCAIFMVFIMLLDALFTLIFNNLLG